MIRRALLFDYDGLIVDSETLVGRVFIEILAEDGHEIAFEDFGHLLGSTGAENDARWEAFVRERIGEHASLADIEARMMPLIRQEHPDLPVLPGVRELIAEAKAAGWLVGLGTGNDGPLEDYLTGHGLLDEFDAIVRTATMGLPSKPAPDVFLELAKRLDVEPENCVVLEDSLPGCQAAIAAGMRVIICPSLATKHCTFPDGTHIVETLEGLGLPV